MRASASERRRRDSGSWHRLCDLFALRTNPVWFDTLAVEACVRPCHAGRAWRSCAPCPQAASVAALPRWPRWGEGACRLRSARGKLLSRGAVQTADVQTHVRRVMGRRLHSCSVGARLVHNIYFHAYVLPCGRMASLIPHDCFSFSNFSLLFSRGFGPGQHGCLPSVTNAASTLVVHCCVYRGGIATRLRCRHP